MSDLTDFLLARIAEDEDLWRLAIDKRLAFTATGTIPAIPPTGFSERKLAECEAKRRIVEWHRPSTDHGEAYTPYCVGCWEDGGMDGAPNYPCRNTRWIALPYADHPDYREEWKP